MNHCEINLHALGLGYSPSRCARTCNSVCGLLGKAGGRWLTSPRANGWEIGGWIARFLDCGWGNPSVRWKPCGSACGHWTSGARAPGPGGNHGTSGLAPQLLNENLHLTESPGVPCVRPSLRSSDQSQEVSKYGSQTGRPGAVAPPRTGSRQILWVPPRKPCFNRSRRWFRYTGTTNQWFKNCKVSLFFKIPLSWISRGNAWLSLFSFLFESWWSNALWHSSWDDTEDKLFWHEKCLHRVTAHNKTSWWVQCVLLSTRRERWDCPAEIGDAISP